MRILLIQPPVQDFYQTAIRTYPLGLAYLAAVLREDGFEVAIVDAHDPARRRTIPLPARFKYMRRYYAPANKSPFRLFDHYYHFGLSLAEISERIRSLRPDLIGIACLFSPYSETGLDIARLAKKFNPRTVTVMGGHHVWAMPTHVLDSGAVDFIIRGEAEFSFLALCRQLRNRAKDLTRIAAITGIGFKTGKRSYLHPEFAVIRDLDAVPLPARDLLDHRQYTVGGRICTMLLTSRGCPHSCGFCALSASPCAAYRTRAPEKVLAEIADCRRLFAISHFDIEDDNFTADKKHAAAVLDGVRAMQDPEIRLSAMNGLSACNLTPELLAAMRDTGFTRVDLALVTGDPGRRRAVARPGGLEQFDHILGQAGNYGFRTTAHIILGLPEDTIANMLQSILHLLTRPCMIGANIYYPVPGSTLFSRHPEQIRHKDPSCWRSTLASCESYPGHRDEYMTLFYLTRIVNHAKQLLAGLGQQSPGQAPPLFRDFIVSRAAELVHASDLQQFLADRLIRRHRLDGERLGLFMLRRFAEKKQIERILIENHDGRVTYVFAEEFCNRRIVEEFWQQAANLPLRAPGV